MYTPDQLSNGPKFALTYFACGGNLREVTHHMKLDTFVKIFCAAIVLLGCCVLISNAAHADERTKNPFVQCIAQQATNNESACLDKLGRIEWHPIKSPDSCISVGQNLKLADQNKIPLPWEALFKNERCRRLGEPFYKRAHQPDSNAASADERAANPYVQCVEQQVINDVSACLEKVGRIEWYPFKSPDSCANSMQILRLADRRNWKMSWAVLFDNERCRRLGVLFYQRSM
jgi:hypothetical protein